MKSRFGSAPGNANLKGKMGRLLSCRCCSVFNLKRAYLAKLAKKEMRENAK